MDAWMHGWMDGCLLACLFVNGNGTGTVTVMVMLVVVVGNVMYAPWLAANLLGMARGFLICQDKIVPPET
jgi:hypothetical protein